MPWWFFLVVVLSGLALLLVVLGFVFPPTSSWNELFAPGFYTRLPYPNERERHHRALEQLRTRYLQAIETAGIAQVQVNRIEQTPKHDHYSITMSSEQRIKFHLTASFRVTDGYHARLDSCQYHISSPHWFIPITEQEAALQTAIRDLEALLEQWTQEALAIVNQPPP